MAVPLRAARDDPIQHFQIGQQGAEFGPERCPAQFGDGGGKCLNVVFRRPFIGVADRNEGGTSNSTKRRMRRSAASNCAVTQQ